MQVDPSAEEAAAFDLLDAFIEADPVLAEGAGQDGVDAEDLEQILGEPSIDEDLVGVEVDFADVVDEISSSDEDDAPEAPAAVPFSRVRYDALTGKVTLRDDTSENLGRISLIKQGTPQEAVSVYCRRHG